MYRRIARTLLLTGFGWLAALDDVRAQPASTGIDSWTSPQVVSDLLENRLAMPAFVPGEVIFKPAENDGRFDTARFFNEDDKLEELSDGALLLRLGGDRFVAMSEERQRDLTLNAVERLRRDPAIEYAQPNFLFQIVAVPRDPFYEKQWHYFDRAATEPPGGIGLPSAWETTTGTGGVIVAVIDTGIVGGHPDLAGSQNLLPGIDMISDPRIAGDGDGRDRDPLDLGDGVPQGYCEREFGGPIHTRDLPDSWHGSHVAGTVGAGITDNDIGIAGVNWSVKVLPIRALGKCGGTSRDIQDAIRWAAGLPVRGVNDNPSPAHIINLSLGGRGSCSGSPRTQEAINAARQAGVTVIVAAGNESEDASLFSPASCDGVITVGAADRRGHFARRYSNFGLHLDLLAPGGDVRRDDDRDGVPDGVLSYVQNGYDLYNGTSMAAPHVAGVAALLKSRHPNLTPAQIEAELKRHARPFIGTECSVGRGMCGAGLLDATFLALPDPPPDDVAAPAE